MFAESPNNNNARKSHWICNRINNSHFFCASVVIWAHAPQPCSLWEADYNFCGNCIEINYWIWRRYMTFVVMCVCVFFSTSVEIDSNNDTQKTFCTGQGQRRQQRLHYVATTAGCLSIRNMWKEKKTKHSAHNQRLTLRRDSIHTTATHTIAV